MNIFLHSDYKKILRGLLDLKPGKGHGEYAKIARHLGVHSSLVSQVMSGGKDFTVEQLQEICAYLGTNELESEFLLFLLEHDRAGTLKLRAYWKKKIDEIRDKAKVLANRLPQERLLGDNERAIFYSSWLYSAIRIYCSIGDGKNLEEITTRLRISREQGREVLRFLLEAQLVMSEAGIYKVGPQLTHLEFGSPFLPRHHANWRLQSIAHSEGLSADELMFTGPLTISKRDFQEVRELIAQLIRSVSDRVKSTAPDDVACLNIDWFWLKR